MRGWLVIHASFNQSTHACYSYDFFYKNGVPKWRGTGYYYARFRPGLGVRVGEGIVYETH